MFLMLLLLRLDCPWIAAAVIAENRRLQEMFTRLGERKSPNENQTLSMVDGAADRPLNVLAEFSKLGDYLWHEVEIQSAIPDGAIVRAMAGLTIIQPIKGDFIGPPLRLSERLIGQQDAFGYEGDRIFKKDGGTPRRTCARTGPEKHMVLRAFLQTLKNMTD